MSLNCNQCGICGRFISYQDPDARFHFEPDNAFGHEESWWICRRCVREEMPTEPIPEESSPSIVRLK